MVDLLRPLKPYRNPKIQGMDSRRSRKSPSDGIHGEMETSLELSIYS